MTDYKSNFAKNVRSLRKGMGLTQQQLADITGYSEKTISKWECGAAVPEIGALFGLAGILNTSVEKLFCSDDSKYYLGIDGGGTKTEFVLADETGKVIRTEILGTCNPIDIGMENSKKILKQGIYKVCGEIPLWSVTMFAGIAGGSSGDTKRSLCDFFSSFGFAHFENDSDNRNTVTAGLDEEDGIALILGTGICAYTQKDKKHTKTSGWGYLLDEGGSAYNIGRDALSAYYRAMDGTGEPTQLTEIINKAHPEGHQLLLGEVYKQGKKFVASVAPLAFEAAASGDKVAEEIIERNMQCVAHIIETAAKPFETDKVSVVIAGGLTNQPVIPIIKKHLKTPERFDISILSQSPVMGAVKLAMKGNN